MSKQHENQHYVSQVLLRRFTDSGFLQRFHIKTNTWKRVSPKQVFSQPGYTQLIADGTIDNSLEVALKAQEDKLPLTLQALDKAANGGTADLGNDVFNNLCRYCAYLWSVSPFAKAVAPLEFVMQLDLDLKNGRTDLLKLVGIQEKDIDTIQNLHSKGTKFIIQANDYLQLIFRIRFNAKCQETFTVLRYYTPWTLYHSPVEVPVPDVAFFKLHVFASQTTLYCLPVAPHLVLIGKMKNGVPTQSTDTAVRVDTLSQQEAEYIRDALCLSAITALAFKTRIDDVPAARQRATDEKISFPKIKDLDAVLSAGMKDFTGDLILLPTTKEAYVKFVKSFVEP